MKMKGFKSIVKLPETFVIGQMILLIKSADGRRQVVNISLSLRIDVVGA